MNGIKIVDWNGHMDFRNIEFEHTLRVLNNTVREFKRKPDERERQLALFRALQSTRLLYNDLSRMGQAENDYGIGKLNAIARHTKYLLSIDVKPSPVLRSVRKQWKAICDKIAENRTRAKYYSKHAKATVTN